MYCKGAGAAAEYCTGAEECVVGSTTPVRRGGTELQGRGPRKCIVREKGPQQSTVRERRSVWWGPQHPCIGGGGATGPRPAEVYCKGAGAAAEYSTGEEECVVGSTTPVRRGGAELQGRGPRKCTVREKGPQQTVRERRSGWWGPQHPSVGGGAELQGRGPRNPTVGRDPSVQGDDQLRLSLRQRSRQPFAEKFRGARHKCYSV